MPVTRQVPTPPLLCRRPSFTVAPPPRLSAAPSPLRLSHRNAAPSRSSSHDRTALRTIRRVVPGTFKRNFWLVSLSSLPVSFDHMLCMVLRELAPPSPHPEQSTLAPGPVLERVATPFGSSGVATRRPASVSVSSLWSRVPPRRRRKAVCGTRCLITPVCTSAAPCGLWCKNAHGYARSFAVELTALGSSCNGPNAQSPNRQSAIANR